jgi:hypothetical protein
MVNLYEFHSYNLTWKLTAFLKFQESTFRNMIVEVSGTTECRSLDRSR